MTAPFPLDEAERLQALRASAILDTTPDQDFDDLTELAAEICNAPIAFTSLVDSDRQWFKARVGTAACETSRDVSFCAHAILTPEIMIVPDAALDPRFADNPSVTGDPHYRFYAGMPLRTADGHALGTLCVLDVRPRQLDAHQVRALERLGRQAARLLDMRHSLRRADQAEVAQARSEGLLRTVVSGAPIMIFSLDKNGICTLSDGMGLAELGFAPGQLVGQSMLEMYKDFPEILGYFRRALSGEAFTIELTMGDHVYESRYSPIFDANGKVNGFIGVSVDVTDRQRQAEQIRDHAIVLEFQNQALEEASCELAAQNEALERSRDEALAATRAKSEFLANMSHEIRTPMNGVLGMTDLLLRRPLDDKARHYAQTVRSSAEALLVILNDILDFSKIEAGKMTIEETEFDLTTLADEITDLLVPRAVEKGLRLTRHVAPDVPNVLRGDPTRLRQVLTNLVGNAIKFTEAGGIGLATTLQETVNGVAHIRLSVTDTGIGIPMERQAQIFDSFTQADGSTSRRFGGTGLGLTICRQLAELMGGRIGLESRPGEGSTFFLDVPLAIPEIVSPTVLGDTPPNLDAPPLAGLRVLLAEDNPINREVAVSFLEDWGCRVACAEDGQEALDCLDADEFDIVLMDVQMPRVSGLEATACIRAREAAVGGHLPIIAMTAGVTEGEREGCDESGMDGFVSKPFEPDDLLIALRGWTGHF